MLQFRRIIAGLDSQMAHKQHRMLYANAYPFGLFSWLKKKPSVVSMGPQTLNEAKIEKPSLLRRVFSMGPKIKKPSIWQRITKFREKAQKGAEKLGQAATQAKEVKASLFRRLFTRTPKTNRWSMWQFAKRLAGRGKNSGISQPQKLPYRERLEKAARQKVAKLSPVPIMKQKLENLKEIPIKKLKKLGLWFFGLIMLYSLVSQIPRQVRLYLQSRRDQEEIKRRIGS